MLRDGLRCVLKVFVVHWQMKALVQSFEQQANGDYLGGEDLTLDCLLQDVFRLMLYKQLQALQEKIANSDYLLCDAKIELRDGLRCVLKVFVVHWQMKALVQSFRLRRTRRFSGEPSSKWMWQARCTLRCPPCCSPG
jgi:hypothetical protein